MTQYRFVTPQATEVLYGLDKPTGGYFYTEFDQDEEPIRMHEGMGLKQFIHTMDKLFEFHPVWLQGRMVDDFLTSEYPTPLQENVYSMFGKGNLKEKLKELQFEINNEINQ